MHYYQFHIGDYRAATSHLSNEEDLAYRRLLDMYYDTEAPIPLDTQWVSRRIRIDSNVVATVLKDMFQETPEGWFHPVCDRNLKQYIAKAETARTNGKSGGRPRKNPVGFYEEPDRKLTNNHKPITREKQSRGTRLPADWKPSEEEISFCKSERPDLNPMAVASRFRDYWIAQPGQKGVKANWTSTWRNWVRAEKVVNVSATTQPMRKAI
jgi:uncharacterized protein YdaU (DUF1376 family)